MTRQVIQPVSLVDPRPRYSQGIVTTGGRLLFIAGQTSVDATGRVIGKGDIERQSVQVFENVGAVLAAAGGTFANLVMTTTYLTDLAQRAAFSAVRARYYGPDVPASTLVVVTSLTNADLLVEVDAIAVI